MPNQHADNPIDRLTPEQLELARIRKIKNKARLDELNKLTLEALQRAGEEWARREKSK